MTDTSDSDSDKIVRFKPAGWLRRAELALELGVSTRTVERKVKAGLIEKMVGPNALLYRVVQSDRQSDKATVAASQGRSGRQAERQGDVASLREVLEAQIEALRAENARAYKALGVAEMEVGLAVGAVEEAHLAVAKMQMELIEARAEVARVRLALKKV